MSAPQSDYRLLSRDGNVVWVQDDEIVVDGAAQGFLQDVTAQKQDRVRLELMVGILSLAADDTPPDEIVAHAADRLAELFGDAERHLRGARRRRQASGSAIRPTREVSRSGTTSTGMSNTSSASSREARSSSRTSAPSAGSIRSASGSTTRGVASFVDVPLLRHGKLHGVLWINSSRTRTWGEHEVSVLTDVGGQLAVVLSNARASEQRQLAERDLRNRDAILEAVSRSAELLLAQPSLDEAMDDLMRILGEATQASGAYVFQNLPPENGVSLTVRTACWSSGRWRSTIDDPRLAHVAPAPHFPRWAEILGRGEVVSSHVRDLPPDERDAMELTDSLSVLAVPIFVAGRWWGFIVFEECARERVWSAAETDALRAAAGLIAAALNRELAEQSLRRRDAVLEAVSHGAARLLAELSWRDVAQAFMNELGEAARASRSYLFENVLDTNGELISWDRFEWVADGVEPLTGKSELQPLNVEDAGLNGFAPGVDRNEIISSNGGHLSALERDFFESEMTRSVVAVPIFVGDDWWGFIGFDDCDPERVWSAAESDALRTAASLISAAIERERAEAVLREHEQKLRAVFDTALDAIFITDNDRRYVDVNPAACDYLGVARNDLIGRRIDDFLPPHKLATIEADQAAYLAGGPVLTEWESQRSDGSLRIAEASAHPNFVPGLHIAFLRDVTERKRLETELLNAQKLESLGRLAGGVAHDFNNLLTGISGYASLLLERVNGDAELARDLGEIKRASDRAAELTKQLLAFGRRQMFKPRPLDLNAVIDDVAGLLQRLLGDQIELDVRPEHGLGVVHADPGQVEQVIVNLVVNARDALPDGGRVTIRTRNADDGWIELLVADDGVGMDESTRSQIFEPFFTTRDQGVGLGLASVYGIVHQSGGEVSVESEPGAGATFTVRLPRVREAAEATSTPAPAAEPSQGSETVLLVEDEDVVRDLARRVLERHGYTVFACSHGAEAVELSDRHLGSIELLLTDVVMPGLRGYEVARRVAVNRPQIKILYMSGYAEEALRGGPAVGAAAALIEKPFAIDALARRVREMLEAPEASG